MSNSQYEILGLATDCHRVKWRGPLENSRPADDVEQLVLELYHNDSARGEQHLELDLSDCPSINTRGITFLIYLRRRLLELGVPWSIHNAPPLLHRILEMLNLETAFKRSNGPIVGLGNAANASFNTAALGNKTLEAEQNATSRAELEQTETDPSARAQPSDSAEANGQQEYIEISRNS